MPIADMQDLVEFIVLDIEPQAGKKGRFVLAEATIAPAADMDKTYYVKTHLGALLHPGDSVLGFDLSGSNFNSAELDAIGESRRYAATVPDVVLVKKHYPRRKKARSRAWKLRRMAREEADMAPRKQDQDRLERDYEMFLRDVEEDAEMRVGLNLYKQRKVEDEMETESSVGENDGLRVPMEELLDDFEEMHIEDKRDMG
jgi:nonsense-mediated mRNA decay protein 3